MGNAATDEILCMACVFLVLFRNLPLLSAQSMTKQLLCNDSLHFASNQMLIVDALKEWYTLCPPVKQEIEESISVGNDCQDELANCTVVERSQMLLLITVRFVAATDCSDTVRILVERNRQEMVEREEKLKADLHAREKRIASAIEEESSNFSCIACCFCYCQYR